MFPWPLARPAIRLSFFLLAAQFSGILPLCGAPMVSDYVVHVWQAENGLPQDSVTSVLQTRNGYIWIGTYSALARFDGVHFTVFDAGTTPSMLNSRVTSLFEARDGTLWIGHEDGAVTDYRAARFETKEFQTTWMDKAIFYIGEDDTGDIWLASRDHIFTRMRDGQTCPSPPDKDKRWVSIAISPKGIWLAGEKTVSVLQHGNLAPMQFGVQPPDNIQGICPGKDGGFWVANNGSLQEWKGAKCLKDWGPMPWDLNQITTMFETGRGKVVVGTSKQGLYVVSGPGTTLHFSRANGLPSDWITSGMEDREGDVWLGTRDGLVMLHPTGITVAAPPDKYDGYPVLSVATGSEGQLWAATEGMGIYRLKDGEWSHYGKESGLSNIYVWAVSPDVNGHLWAGTWGGVFVQNGNTFERPPGLGFTLPALALFHETNGDTWVGTCKGLWRYHNGKAEWVVQGGQLASTDVRCIERDKKGVLWFGTFGGGLGCLKDGKLQQFRKTDGLPSDFVQCLRMEADGTLWIGTFDGGLARFKDGHFSTVNWNVGLPGNDIGDIEDDGHGFFWISSNSGIMRISLTNLDSCADGLTQKIYYRLFAENEGVPTMGCSGGLQPSGCKLPDGRLMFPSSEGVVTIDPENVPTNLMCPPVHLEDVLVDNNKMGRNPGSPALRIPPGLHRLEINYTALSYSSPDRVLFKYWLEGMDKDWGSAGTQRAALYNDLPPGNYTFHVMACNNDGMWNKRGAQISFAVLPFFWQELWFRILAGATALSLVAGIVWLDARQRLRRKLERIEQQYAVEQERVRIAHNIHDDLGTYLTRIIMLSDPARNRSENGSSTAVNLNNIHETACELTEAMGETVWAVNPQHDTLDSLINYLQKFAQEFLSHAGIRCRLDMPFQLPPWSLSAEMRHNLFMAFKETLNNIVKHAGASEVQISLIIESTGFLLLIRDNGLGIAGDTATNGVVKQKADRNGGNGLRNIQRRITRIGGRCEINTVPRLGTCVEFKVPIRIPPG